MFDNSQKDDFDFSAEEPESKKSVSTESKGESRSFKPAEGGASHSSDDVSPLEEDEMFSFAEEKFNILIDRNKGSESGDKIIQTSTEKKSLSTDELMSPEMIEVSAVFYVEMLEALISGVCSWYSGISGNYDFDKKMKDRYQKISALYFKAQNIQLTPTHFFAMMTVFLLIGSGTKAHKDRKKRLTAENFAKKSRARNDNSSAGSQTSLFEVERSGQRRLYFAAERDEETGEAYYTKHPLTGVYSKKGDRQEVEPELKDFVFDFKSRNKGWPTRKQVDDFLKL